MQHTIELDSAYLQFGNLQILRGAYISIRSGVVTGLLGNNGSGKTCMLNMLYGTFAGNPTGLSNILSGSSGKGECNVMLDGKRFMKAFRRPGVIRYAPQFGFVPGHLTPEKVFEDYNVDMSEFRALFPIFDEFAGTRIRNLSGGERRLIEMYVILKSGSLFCMLDEPFSQLMPIHANFLKRAIAEEAHAGKGILLTDHAYRYMLDVSDTIYLLREGSTYVVNEHEKLHSLGYLPFQLPVTIDHYSSSDQ